MVLLLLLQLQCLFVAQAGHIDVEHCLLVDQEAEFADVFFQINRGKPAFHEWNVHRTSVSLAATAANDSGTSTARPTLWAPLTGWKPHQNAIRKKTESIAAAAGVSGLRPDFYDVPPVAVLAAGTTPPKVIDPPIATDNLVPLRSHELWQDHKFKFSKVFWWTVGGTIVVVFVVAWSVVHFKGQILFMMKYGLHGKHGDKYGLQGKHIEYLEGKQWKQAELVHHDDDGDMLLRRTDDGMLLKKAKETTSMRKAAQPAIVPPRAVAAAAVGASLAERMTRLVIPESKPPPIPADNDKSESEAEQEEDENELALKVAIDASKTAVNIKQDVMKAGSEAKHAVKSGLMKGKQKIEQAADEAEEAVDDALTAAREVLEDPGAALMEAIANTDQIAGAVGKAAEELDDALDDLADKADAMADAAKSKLGKFFGVKKAGSSKSKAGPEEKDAKKSEVKSGAAGPSKGGVKGVSKGGANSGAKG